MLSRKKLSKDVYGLIGKNINYSFSPDYFNKKFDREAIFASYRLFNLNSIKEVQSVYKQVNIKGLNVTIPYKQDIIPFLDELSPEAKAIGAVNTIQFKDNRKIGHNTDWIGFAESIKPILQLHHKKALILGTGGASLAVAFALKTLNIPYKKVSRQPSSTDFSYQDLSATVMDDYKLIINTTPLGTYPNINNCPNLNYKLFSSKHLAYDLIYNPLQTKFLQSAKRQGSVVKNGLEMLQIQADAAWKIWNE